jgi:hypothetical protein
MMASRALAALARAVVGRPPPRPSEPEIPLPAVNPLASGDGAQGRRDAALKLLEDDCYGFVLLTVHRRDDRHGRIDLAIATDPSWWSAIRVVLGRIITASQRL